MKTKEIEIYIDGKLISKGYDVKMFANNSGDIVSFELKSKPERQTMITESEFVEKLEQVVRWGMENNRFGDGEAMLYELKEKLFSKGEE